MPIRSNELCVTMMPSHSPLAILAVRNLRRSLREVLLAGDEQLGVGVELHELAGELFQHVIGHDVDRLFDQPGLLHLHAGGGHRERLAGADDVGQQRVARSSCRARRHPSGAAAARSSGSCRENRDASRRRAGGGDCCRCRCKAAPAARCGRDRRTPTSGIFP